jgi:CheY-like chemotaxis protein
MRAEPQTLRVLVVDDCPDTACSFTELLLLYGFDTRSTGCGCVALALCAAWRPDVVLLDLWMPGVSGFEVARHLRERDGAVRLVAVTGLGTREYRERARAVGFHHFLVKPVEPAVLVDLLQGVCRDIARAPAAAHGSRRLHFTGRPGHGAHPSDLGNP